MSLCNTVFSPVWSCPICKTIIDRDTLRAADSPVTDWGPIEDLVIVVCPSCRVVRHLERGKLRAYLDREDET